MRIPHHSAATDTPRFWGGLAAVTVVGAFARFWHLGRGSLWLDEGVSVGLVRMPWDQMWRALWIREANMTFYYLLLRAWMVFGDSEFWLRSLSAVCGVLSIILLANFARRLYGSAVAIVTAALFAVNVLDVSYSRYVRGYGLAVLLILLSWDFFERALRDDRPFHWALWGVITLASIYTHLYASLLFAAQLLSLALYPSATRRLRRIMIVTACICVGCLPLVAFVLTTNGHQLAWVPPPFSKRVIDDFIGEFSGGQLLPLLLSLGTFLVIVVLAIRSAMHFRRSESAWRISLPVLGTLVPVLLLLLISIYQPTFFARYLVVALPFFLLGIAIALVRMPRWFSAPLLLLIVAGYLLGLRTYLNSPSWNDFRGATTYIARNSSPADALIIWEPLARGAVGYYIHRLHVRSTFPTIVFPSDGPRFTAADLDSRPVVGKINSLSKRYSRVWLVFDFDVPESDYPIYARFFLERLKLQYREHSLRHFAHVQVLEFSDKRR